MGYGYSFLRVPGGVSAEDKGRIEEMELDELTRYMCPKTHGDPEKCLDECPGFKTCRVGQRAAVLLAEEKKPRAVTCCAPPPAREPVSVPDEIPDLNEERHLRGRASCVDVLAQEDPVGYLVKVKGLKPKSAQSTLNRWRRKYPDLFAKQPETAPEAETDQEESDLIGLEDFLKGCGVIFPSEEARIIELPEENENAKLADLMRQEAELLDQVAGLQRRIWQIRDERRLIERKMSH